MENFICMERVYSIFIRFFKKKIGLFDKKTAEKTPRLGSPGFIFQPGPQSAGWEGSNDRPIIGPKSWFFRRQLVRKKSKSPKFFQFSDRSGCEKKVRKKIKNLEKIFGIFFKSKKIRREKGHFFLVGQSDPKSDLLSLLLRFLDTWRPNEVYFWGTNLVWCRRDTKVVSADKMIAWSND